MKYIFYCIFIALVCYWSFLPPEWNGVSTHEWIREDKSRVIVDRFSNSDIPFKFGFPFAIFTPEVSLLNMMLNGCFWVGLLKLICKVTRRKQVRYTLSELIIFCVLMSYFVYRNVSITRWTGFPPGAELLDIYNCYAYGWPWNFASGYRMLGGRSANIVSIYALVGNLIVSIVTALGINIMKNTLFNRRVAPIDVTGNRRL